MIIQSCNGLFLCEPLDTSETTFYVLNPTTNKFPTLVLPAPAVASVGQPFMLLGYALAFDPSKSPHYKVFFLQSINEGATAKRKYCPYYHIHVYSSEDQSWRLVTSSSFVQQPNVNYKQGVYWNGALDWVGVDSEISYYHIDNESVTSVYYPFPPMHCTRRNFQVSDRDSHLQLIDIYVSWTTCITQFEVLEMGRDYSGWSVKYHVDFDLKLTPVSNYYTHLFLVTEEVEGEESSSMLLHSPA